MAHLSCVGQKAMDDVIRQNVEQETENSVNDVYIQSQPYEGLNSKCLARIYANKNYTTSGGSGSRKRTHTNTKASKNYATKPPDEEPRTDI